MRAALFTLLLACSPTSEEAVAPSPAAASPTVEAAVEEATDEAADEQGPWIGAERDAEHAEERIAARHILISWKGAVRTTGVTRDRDEARALALDVRARLERGEDFATLARAWSDDRGTARRGGALGAFGRGVMQKEFEDAAFALAPETLSGLVETPFGFHLIERLPIVEAHLGEILLRWDTKNADGTPRSREQTRALAEAAAASLDAGEPFTQVASQRSEGSVGPWGGDLGWFQKGQLSPTLDRAAFALDPGERSEIVESQLGLHILYRIQ